MAINLAQYQAIKEALPKGVTLCIVSKHHTTKDILDYYALGERIFAENRLQELQEKYPLKEDIQWHFIGHVQKNKVRQIVPMVSMIQSVDSIALVDCIQKECVRIQKKMPILAEFHLALDDTHKTGLLEEEADAFFTHCQSLDHILLEGIMVMGPHTTDINEIHQVFQKAQDLFETLKKKYPITTLSMGMSDDYPIALAHGSTMVRIGSALYQED
ncbi:MAG: YggS family pyridoxal phosphate-dependent enzyme [Solobacterium sp.]|nr:YggS family pyridoxal phosphate-dependent enzyme [Solobacterium sp.]